MPIRIYLDTSDYYKLYENRTPELEKIFQFLKENVEEKKIEIGFSYPILAELLQDFKPEFRENRIKRAQCIKVLCQKNSFRYFDKITEKTAFSKEGYWFPDLENILSLREMRDRATRQLTQFVKDRVGFYTNRKERRKINRQLRVDRLLKEHPELIEQSNVDYNELKIPISRKFIEENMLMRYLAGQVPPEDIKKEFLEVVTDIELFIATWFDYARKGNSLYDHIHSMTSGIKNFIITVQELREKVESSKDRYQALKRQIKKSGNLKLYKNELSELKDMMPELPLISREWMFENMRDKNIRKFFPDSFFDALSAYINAQSYSSRKIEDSDMPDIMHAIYLPYCDLWRGDRAFSTLLIQQDIPHKEKIVSDLLELPERIQNIGSKANAY